MSIHSLSPATVKLQLPIVQPRSESGGGGVGSISPPLPSGNSPSYPSEVVLQGEYLRYEQQNTQGKDPVDRKNYGTITDAAIQDHPGYYTRHSQPRFIERMALDAYQNQALKADQVLTETKHSIDLFV